MNARFIQFGFGRYTPNIWAWRHCLVEGTPCRIMRDGVLSRGTYTFIRFTERPGGAPSFLRMPWVIVHNGERELKSPLPFTTIVPLNRTRSQVFTGQPSTEMV